MNLLSKITFSIALLSSVLSLNSCAGSQIQRDKAAGKWGGNTGISYWDYLAKGMADMGVRMTEASRQVPNYGEPKWGAPKYSDGEIQARYGNQ